MSKERSPIFGECSARMQTNLTYIIGNVLYQNILALPQQES